MNVCSLSACECMCARLTCVRVCAQGLYPFGDLKANNSARYPIKELEGYVGHESGDWATMSTKIAGKPAFGVAHRRGGAVSMPCMCTLPTYAYLSTFPPCSQIHTYLSTHSTTRRGRDQSHKDDAGEDGHVNPPRKCPRVLNDWTQAQPHVDKSNRWRQRILAIEERFAKTRSLFDC